MTVRACIIFCILTRFIEISQAYNFSTSQTILSNSTVESSDGAHSSVEYECGLIRKNFSRKWFGKGSYLTSYLADLREKGCTQYKQECITPIYNFTKFTGLVYDLFCRRQDLLQKCTDEIQGIVNDYKFNVYLNNDTGSGDINTTIGQHDNSLNETWTLLASSLDTSKMNLDDLVRPCVAVALFDRPSGGVGRFHEILETFIPFCDITWTGYDIDTAMDRGVSPWTNISQRCKVSIVICLIIIIIIGIGIIIANITVLYVFLSNKKLLNSQAIYKISIAVGDLLIGIIIFPNLIIFQYFNFLSPRTMGRTIASAVADVGGTNTPLMTRHPGSGNSFLNPIHIRIVGYLTTSSLMVSIYTLLLASVDRFWAVYRPLKYVRSKAIRYAKYACPAIWLLAAAIAIIPIFVKNVEYELVASMIVTLEGSDAVIFLAIDFLIPLILLWGFTIATYRVAKTHAKNRQKLTNSSSEEMQKRLIRILAIMVGVFSACTVPVILILLLPHFLSNISYLRPDKLDQKSAMVYNSFEYCISLILLTNSLWNCFIYNARNKEFREATKNAYKVLATKLGIVYVIRGARNVSRSVFNLGQKSLNATRRRSSGATYNLTPVVVSSTATQRESASGSSSEQVGFSSKGAKVAFVNEKDVPKKGEYANEDSTFGSFAVDAGADRLFRSVMDNIDEIEEG